jgi:CHAT domain-containing protein
VTDEVFATSTAFLAAGSACVLASLWPVDDLATALLMTKFYEVLFEGRRPPEALRQAQLWLRSLSDSEEAAFLEAHPELESEASRRRQGRGPSPSGSTAGQQTPYSAPSFWAPFIALGA